MDRDAGPDLPEFHARVEPVARQTRLGPAAWSQIQDLIDIDIREAVQACFQLARQVFAHQYANRTSSRD
jgi:hypothetical protein